MNIISIDTSSKFCSLSIQLSGNIRDSIVSNLALSHSSELAVNLKKLINKYQIKISDLDFVLVNVGPGSFTGLRIGVSFAKGLCLSNNIPLIPINSFDMIDSKVDCNEKIFYYGVYSHKNFIYGKKYNKNVRSSKPRLISLEEEIDNPMYVFGLDESDNYNDNVMHVSFDPYDLIDVFINMNKKKKLDLNSINPIYIDYNDKA